MMGLFKLKLNILFVHTVCPAQFSDLCEYLNSSGLANAFYMTVPGHKKNYDSRYRNLLSLKPDGNIIARNAYYYSGKIERAARISLGLYRELSTFPKKIDLIVAHGTWGSPHLIFDEFDVPVITYIEFPSYADHGWDPKYPPDASQRLADKSMQMLSYYQVIKSDLTLVPSDYARQMFPELLRDRISVQFEGIDKCKVNQHSPANVYLPSGMKTIGFAALDLSSAKGLETFIETAAFLIKSEEAIHFVVIGDPDKTTYGYESLFLERKYGKNSKVTFQDHLMRKFKADPERFTFTGKLPYPEFSDLLNRVDVFAYPVKFGSGNWGLLELLIRGCAVVAANRCYVPEMIKHNQNGVLVQGDDPKVWGAELMSLLNDEYRIKKIRAEAKIRSSKYDISTVAKNYMSIFSKAISNHKAEKKT